MKCKAIQSVGKSILFGVAFLVGSVTLSQATHTPPYIDFDLTVAGVPVMDITGSPGEEFTLTWTKPVDIDSQTAVNTYTIYAGLGAVDPLTSGAVIAIVSDVTSVKVDLSAATRSFLVRASNAVSGTFAQTGITVFYFMATGPCKGDGGLKRADSAGTQIGMGQQWTFTYSLMSDSEVTATIYSTATTFSLNGRGFPFASSNTTPIKVLADHVPRSGAMSDCSVSNQEIWDSRNSSGTLVPNGIYFVHFLATNPLLPGTTLFAAAQTVPVDILRFTKFDTKGISAGGGTASVDYTITGDATIRIVIAKPGRKMVLDSSGDVQSLNAAGTAIDSTTNSVVQVLVFNRKAGSYAETWNGTDQNSVAVSSGIYSVGLSAKDAFGNQAVALSSNDFLLAGSIPIDRAASQTASDTTAPSVSSITVGSAQISLSGGTTLSGSFTSMIIGLDETAGTGVNAPSVTLTDPGGSSVSGSLSISGSAITFTPTTTQSSTGTYTVAVVPKDTVGNTGATVSVAFVLQAVSSSGGGGGAAISQQTFKSSMIPYPNPAKTSPAKIDYTLSNTATTVDFDVFNILGEPVYHKTYANVAAGLNTISWSLVNDDGSTIGNGVYIFRLRAKDSTQTLEAVKKLMVIQ